MKIKNTSILIELGNISDFSVEAKISLDQNSCANAGTASILSTGKEESPVTIIAHITGPDQTVTQVSLREAFAQALFIAHQSGFTSIAIAPCVNDSRTLPLVGEAKILIQEVLKLLKTEESLLKKIVFCIPDQATHEIFYNTISGYVTHLRDTLGDGPYVTVDIIIEYAEGILLIERSNPPYGWALPGGFVDYGESVETAAVREAKEETNMDLENLQQFHVYSDPQRDPRFHTVSTVFVAKGIGTPEFGDDAKGLKMIPFDDLLQGDYAFDHKKIIEDYLEKRGHNGS